MAAAKTVCPSCGEKVMTLERAGSGGGYVEILVAPSADGVFFRLNAGRDAGKLLKLEGPILNKAHADGGVLYVEHTCGAGGLF